MPDEIHKIFSNIPNSKVCISFHENGDPDAVGSAIALYEILKNHYGCKVKIIYNSINKISSKLLNSINLKLDDYKDFEDSFDFLILVDTNNPVQVGNILNNLTDFMDRTIIIDHHPQHKDITDFSPVNIIDPSFSSTCEIIFEIGKELDFKFSKIANFLLLAGITYDSRHFIIANKNTFEIAFNLIENDAGYREIISLLNQPKDRSEKIARLKTAKRADLYELGEEWLLAISFVSSYEASGCRSLIDIGADIAVVLSIEKDQVRISSRSTNEFFDKTNLHLGKDLMEPIGSIIEGQGGGHNTAAGCNGKKNPIKAIEKIKELINLKTGLKLKKIKTPPHSS